MPTIYFDNSATTKPYPEVIDTITRMLAEVYGNPSSLHQLGKESKHEVERARKIIADSLGVKPDEIYFTSGGTEADNLAIKGACLANAHLGKHIVTTEVEHPAVTKTIRDLKKQGWKVSYIPALNGVLDLEELEHSIRQDTVLVSAMLVQNETGAIFPVHEIKNIIEKKASPALLHCDAVQGFGKLPFTAGSLGADLISMSGHKLHGPKGIGALYVKKGTAIFSNILGGGQERGLRSGTENTAFIAGFGQAFRITFSNIGKTMDYIAELRNYCLEQIEERLPQAVINSSRQGALHIVNLSMPGHYNKNIVEQLDALGIYISSAAACKSNHSRGPSVLESLGLSREMANSAIRISFSHENTKDEVDILIEELARLYSKSPSS
ncbi:cysteine desulfurase family protein [Bacillus sp. FJAT-18017]|uniref:cysteine desulfurase family protein n=1 Tax=Bacillus sp. FJAT-18017 TaxID=1705566 RepID=UPI0006AFB2F1|nr:cysteine desulfurase family protein [Bacillus sp. FJAT-18017]